MEILDDPEREFAASVFLRLEVLPQAAFNKRVAEVAFYETFFSMVTHWATNLDSVVEIAMRDASANGIEAMDALHVAAAVTVGASELVTTEKRSRSVSDRWAYHCPMNVLLFGATGMVGQAVLRECLRDDGIERVLAVGRSKTGLAHPKLREAGLDISDDDLRGYDACVFCLGVSSAGMSEAEYTRLTYDLTMSWANRMDPSIAFLYVSGAGTGGRAMWAQVKKRTEDALLARFPRAVMIRLAMLWPKHGERSKTRWTRVSYVVFRPLLPLLRAVAPGAVITTEELGRAMIRAARGDAPKRVLESRDLRQLGRATV